jgi:thiosulfate/3-mercaptopyruvate sulfurtransferase
VVFDEYGGDHAARIAWFLHFLGISATVLDGGLGAWRAIGGTEDSGSWTPPSVPTLAVQPQEGFYLVAAQVASRLEAGAGRILDLREYQETTRGPLRGFTIPGAAVLPRSLFLEQGRLRNPDSLDALIGGAVFAVNEPLILMAPNGMEARLPWIALRAMGATNVQIADGGWSEWLNEPGVPLQSLANVSTVIGYQTGHSGVGTLG